jgi:hypothetical protein
LIRIISAFRKRIHSAKVSSPYFTGRKLFLAGLILLSFALSNCKKPEDIGLSTLPSDDLLYTNYTDSSTIVSTTIREDTLRSDELSRIVIGSIKDADFGLTNASYFGQILLSSTPNLIADSSVAGGWAADSLVLSLAYSGSYGDTAMPQHIHVYRLTEDMHVDSTYYSNKTFQTDGVDLATQPSYQILPNTVLTVGTDTAAAPQLRIRLNDALRDEIFSRNSQTEFANNDNWLAYFKGIQIMVDPVASNGGALVYFNPTSASTRMTLYYHEGTESKTYSFTLAGGARTGQTSHDFTGSSVEQQINDSTLQSDYNYIQSLAGLKTRISFPYLKHFLDSGSILINKAELVIKVTSDTSATMPVPDNILLLAKNSADSYEFPIDYYERSYGGAYSSTDKTYTFGITRTIQRILDGTITDYGYTLNILGSMIEGNSAIIGSGKPGGASQMKLRLYYTKLH